MSHLLAILLFSISILTHADEIIVIGNMPASREGALALTPSLAEEPKLAELLTTLPNISFTSGSNRPRFFQIRGVGETGQFEHSQVAALGVFYEGIDLSEEASTLPLIGREFLNVKYGPQSLAWGGKALAGTVEATSCLDQACSMHRGQASGGSYRTYNLSGGSKWNVSSLTGFTGIGRTLSDGYYDNLFLHKPTSKRDETEAVLGLGYHVGNWRVREHHIVMSHRNGYDAWSVTPGFTVLSDHPGQDRHFVHGHSLQYTSGPWQGMTSLTSTQQLESYDEDWGNNPYWNSIGGWNADYNYFSAFERSRFKLHQKLSRKFGDATEVGVHFSKYNEKQIIRSYKDDVLRRTTEPDFTTQSLGLWAKHDWQDEDWVWSAHARVEKQWIALEGIGDTLKGGVEPQLGAGLSLKKVWAPGRTSELMLTRGYRGGGYNTTPGLNRALLPFGPEEIYLGQLSTESGSEGTRWMARIFYQWQHRQQVRTSVQLDPLDPSTFTYYTENQGSSRSYGFESSLSQQWRQWILSGSLGLMNSHFRNRALAQAPPWTYSARLEYAPSAFSAYAQLSGRDGYYFSDDHEFKSHPYSLVDAGTAYRMGRWELKFWVRNIFDVHYPVRAFYFANEPPLWAPKYYTQLGDPRTFGTQLVFEY